MKFYRSFVGTDFLYVLHDDNLAINVEAKLLELVGNLEAVHRTVNRTGGADLHGDLYRLDLAQLLSKSQGLVLDFLELVCALLQLLGEHLAGGGRSDNGLSGRNKVVAAITGFDVDDIVLIAQANDVFFQNNFHTLFLLYYFIKSVTNGSRAK